MAPLDPNELEIEVRELIFKTEPESRYEKALKALRREFAGQYIFRLAHVMSSNGNQEYVCGIIARKDSALGGYFWEEVDLDAMGL